MHKGHPLQVALEMGIVDGGTVLVPDRTLSESDSEVTWRERDLDLSGWDTQKDTKDLLGFLVHETTQVSSRQCGLFITWSFPADYLNDFFP
jgi:hypothetical protein